MIKIVISGIVKMVRKYEDKYTNLWSHTQSLILKVKDLGC